MKNRTKLARAFVSGLLMCCVLLESPSLRAASPGDADGNGFVDGKDYVIWLNHYELVTTEGNMVGDFDNNGTVDGVDYVIWFLNYGILFPTPTPEEIDNRLPWSPPLLTNPQTIQLGTGYTTTNLQTGLDYIIKLPSTKKLGATVIQGGRNIVILGGYISMPPQNHSLGDQRALYFSGQTGIVHIEGVLIDGSAGGEGDAIDINSPQAIVQIQNLRAVGLIGGYDTSLHDHADIIQPWGGVKELRIDHLTGSSNYQGLQIPIDLGPIEKSDLRNVNLFFQDAPPNDGGYMMWFIRMGQCDSAYPISLQNVYLTPQSGRTLARSVWPDPSELGCPPSVTNNFATWPNLSMIQGGVNLGPPPQGDFVPNGSAGLNYVSPGYK